MIGRVRVALVVALVSLGLGVGRGEAHAEGRTYAIIVGHNGAPAGQPDLKPLRYADDDALRFYGLLSRTSGTVVLLTDLDRDTRRRHPKIAMRARTPTSTALVHAARDIAKQIREDLARGEEPVLFLSYSGHGVTNERGESYLTLAGGRLTQTMLMEDVLADLAGAQVHLFIDACNAEAMVSSRGAFDRELETERVTLDRSALSQLFSEGGTATPPKVGAFLASAQNAQAHEWAQIESGVFTHQAISGLLGAADINGDLRVEYGELHAFISSANSDIVDPRARPDIVVRPPDGNSNSVVLDLTDLRDTRWLFGDASVLGRFHVELEGGARLLEANLGMSTRSALALPRDADAYLVIGSREALIPRDADAAIPFDALSFSSAAKAARGPVERAYQTQMFRTPLTVAYYRGFMDSVGLPPTSFGAQRVLPERWHLQQQPALEDALSSRERRLRWRRGLIGTSAALIVDINALSGSRPRRHNI